MESLVASANAFETFSARFRSITGSSVSVADKSKRPTVLSEFLSNSYPADASFDLDDHLNG
jgi:hypothetical protein